MAIVYFIAMYMCFAELTVQMLPAEKCSSGALVYSLYGNM